MLRRVAIRDVVRGIVIKENDIKYTYTLRFRELDNHSAEWSAFIHALEHARELNVSNALLHTDSKLIEDSVNQGYVKCAFQTILKIWRF